MTFSLMMIGLAAVCAVQNATFTAVSRSRNSGDVAYHAKWALASNAVWFVAQLFVLSSVWHAVHSGAYWQIAIAGLVYVTSASAGSAWMMARMLRTEDGKRQVGAR